MLDRIMLDRIMLDRIMITPARRKARDHRGHDFVFLNDSVGDGEMTGGRAAGGDATPGEIGGMGGVEPGGARVSGCRRIVEERGDWRF
jgi:hypothetical protein